MLQHSKKAISIAWYLEPKLNICGLIKAPEKGKQIAILLDIENRFSLN